MGCFGPISNEPEQTVPKEFNDANIRAARRFKARAEAAEKALARLVDAYGSDNPSRDAPIIKDARRILAAVGGSRE